MESKYDWADDWTDDKPVDLKAMDKLVKELREAREVYDKAKADATVLYKEYAAIESQVVAALEAAGKTSYKVDGLGTFSLVSKSVITTPKTIEEKRELFDWIGEKHGEEFLMSKLSINHQALNSFVNEEFKAHADDPAFKIPGLSAPTVRTEARFTKARG